MEMNGTSAGVIRGLSPTYGDRFLGRWGPEGGEGRLTDVITDWQELS